MQDIAPVIAVIGGLVFLAHLLTSVFSRTRVPDVIILIIIGIVVGPVLGLISPEQFGVAGTILVTVTLIIILFESGTALELGVLRSVFSGGITLTIATFLLTMVTVAGLSVWLTDLELIPAFILGAIVGSISEAIVIPFAKQLKMRKDSQAILSIESSMNDVLSIVITMALIQAYQLGTFEVATVTGNLIASFLVAIVAGVAGAFVWSRLLRRIHAIKNTNFTTVASVFVVFGIVEILGFNGAISALAFGITIGNIESLKFYVFREPQVAKTEGLSDIEKAFFSEVAFLLKIFFFVYLGISMELISGLSMQLALILTIIVFVVRIPAVKITISKSIPARDASIMAIMVPKGLAAAVLASIPLQQEIIGGELIKNITYGVILLSIVATSVLFVMLEKTGLSNAYRWILMLTPSKPKLKMGTVSDMPKSSQHLEKLPKKRIIPVDTKLFSNGDEETKNGRTK